MSNEQRDALIMQWKESQTALARAKEVEANLREQVLKLNYSYDPEALREGTENIELGGGYKLKAVFKKSIGFVTGKDQNERIEKALQEIEGSCAEGKFIAERLVNWKPALSKTEYDALDAKTRKIINKVIITKPASPSLELVEPKAK